MNTMNNRAIEFNSRQDSMNPRRNWIGFHAQDDSEARPPTGRIPLMVKLGGLACLISLGLIATPRPSWAQENEKPKTEQTQTKTVTKTNTKHQTHNEQQNTREEGNRDREIQNDHAARSDGLRNVEEGRRLDTMEYRSRLGEGHRFRPEWLGGGYNSFGYGGLTFGFLEPWPADWAYTDNVYVMDVDGGYVLCNPRYPGITVGVIIQ